MDESQGYYYGEDITCYPSSNAKDDGKLNLEFNMARLVTRVSSKNFCIVNPSYELTLIEDSLTGKHCLKIGVGQCSINGMDLIMTNTLQIDPPKDPGHYYIQFHLQRDSSNNVLADFTYGVTKTFQGVRVLYVDEKPDPLTDMDALYLGEFDWDGDKITNLKEDEDKYGRLWAEDIMCKLLDPKHPDDKRLNLQEWLYNVPDWYFSKEGDTIYGPLIMADSRTNNNPGVIVEVDEEGTHFTVKDPSVDNDKLLFYGDVDRSGKIDEKDAQLVQDYIDKKKTLTPEQLRLADVNHDGIVDEKDKEYIENFIKQEGQYGDTGNIYGIQDTDRQVNFYVENGEYRFELGKTEIYQNEKDNVTHFHNQGGINIDAEGPLNLQGDSEILITTEDTHSPELRMTDNEFKVTDPDAPGLTFNVKYPNSTTVQQTLGKAIWQYDTGTKRVKLLQDNVSYLDVVPNSIFEQDITVQDTVYIGPLGNEHTYLQQKKWQMTSDDTNKQTVWTPSTMTMTNKTLSASDNSYILLKNTNDSIHTKIFDDGKIELLNNTRVPTILWKDGNATYDVTLEKIKNEKRLNIQGDLSITNNLTASGSITGNGLLTTNGIITFKRGTNDATITKDNNSSNLRTNGNLYVGSSGQSQLFAGNTVINGTLGIGGNTYQNSECKIDASGNITTSGTITGSKVFNACYNDAGELFKKAKDEIIEYGDVVCIGTDGLVHKVDSVYDIDRVIGVCSDTMGFVLGGDCKDVPEDEQCPVGMIGKIWTKVFENTDINPGDRVTITPFGNVVRSTNKDNVFGIAMSKTKDGKVLLVIK